MKSIATISAAFLLAPFLFAATAFAGPPLVCHSFDIGTEKSLPWTSQGWNLSGSESYNVNNLVADTVAILNTDSTVLVHMETLRRATLYAQKDPEVAKRLLLTLVSRSNAASNTTSAALSTFDVGYLAETMKQYEWISKTSNSVAHNFDGYARIKKAIELDPNNPQMQFAAALVTLTGPVDEHNVYAKKAIAGAQSDPLLARNLSNHFMNPQSETMADMITRDSSVKAAHK